MKRGGVEYRFTTRNTLTPVTAMRLELADGPFTTFTGDWTFKALAEDACKIIDLNFEYRGRLATAALGALLNSKQRGCAGGGFASGRRPLTDDPYHAGVRP